MNQKLLFLMLSFLCFFIIPIPAFAQTMLTLTGKQYHEQINQLWNQQKEKYAVMIKKSSENPTVLYSIQGATNNLLKYAGYCKKYALIDELSSLYLQSMNTLTRTDQYLFAYYPGRPKKSIHPLNIKYRMWIDKKTGQESILDSSQFLYLLSDTVSIIAEIEQKKRTPMMREALSKFVPLLIEHYDRWLFNKPGPFQVRGWGCRYDGRYVPTVMNHYEFLNKKIDKKLGNGKSPAYCNAVSDVDMWIIAGVANVLTVYHKDESLVPISTKEYKNLLKYVKTGVNLLGKRFTYTNLKAFDGKSAAGAVFDAGMWDEHPDRAFAGYSGQDFPKTSPADKSKFYKKGSGWDVSHARRFVHVFDTLIKSRDILGLDFPTKDFMQKMANQLNYAIFNRDFKKPLFTNYMDGSNGWYRLDYSGRNGFGYGPGDMSSSVLMGGYGFWSRYSSDTQKIFLTLANMLKSKDPDIRKHVMDYYETNGWSQYKRTRSFDFEKADAPGTQSLLIQFLPSLCFMAGN